MSAPVVDGPEDTPRAVDTPVDLAAIHRVYPTRTILGVPITVWRRDQAIASLVGAVGSGERLRVAFANPNFVTQLRRHGPSPDRMARFLVLNDGLGIDIASAILFGAKFPDNLNGSDFAPALLDALPAGTRVFVFGGRAEVNDRACALLEARHGIVVCGRQHGFVEDAVFDIVIDRINAARPEVVLVALGNPGQEAFIDAAGDRLDAPLVLGVGALLDFVSGEVRRAPLWLRRLRGEWLFRLYLEPRRMARRYTVDTLGFIILVVLQRFRGRRTEGARQAEALLSQR